MKNARLEQAFKLECRIALYIPNTTSADKIITAAEHRERVERIAGIFSEKFGGASSEKIGGYWMSPEKGLICESPVVVYSSTDAMTLESELDSILDLAESARQEWRQEAISLEVNGTLYITPLKP